MPRGKRRDEEVAARRGRILDAAVRVFAERGFDAAAMQEIAAEAGYATSSLYSYFKGKDEILEALSQQLLADAEALFDVRVPDGLTLRQALELLIAHQNDFAEANRQRFAIFLGAAATFRGCPRDEHSMRVAHMARLTRFLEQHAAPGELGRFGAPVAAAALYGIHTALFSQWVTSGMDDSLRERTADVLDLFEHGVRGPTPGGA